MIDYGLLFLDQELLSEEEGFSLPLESDLYPKQEPLPLRPEAMGVERLQGEETSEVTPIRQGAAETLPLPSSPLAMSTESEEADRRIASLERLQVRKGGTVADRVYGGEAGDSSRLQALDSSVRQAVGEPSASLRFRSVSEEVSFAETLRQGNALADRLRNSERKADLSTLRQAAQATRTWEVDSTMGSVGAAWDATDFDRALERDARRYDRGFLWPG